MENYVLRGVGPEGRTRSNSTVSAGSMGGLMALDGVPMPSKVSLGFGLSLRCGGGQPVTSEPRPRLGDELLVVFVGACSTYCCSTRVN